MDIFVVLSMGIVYFFSVFNILFMEVWYSKGLYVYVYFEVVMVVIVFILFGKLFEENVKGNIFFVLKKLIGL